MDESGGDRELWHKRGRPRSAVDTKEPITMMMIDTARAHTIICLSVLWDLLICAVDLFICAAICLSVLRICYLQFVYLCFRCGVSAIGALTTCLNITTQLYSCCDIRLNKIKN